MTTLSAFPILYEYLHAKKTHQSLFSKKGAVSKEGPEAEAYWLATLLFTCPVPEKLRHLLAAPKGNLDGPLRVYLEVYLDGALMGTRAKKLEYYRDEACGFEAAKEWGTKGRVAVPLI